MAFVGQDYQPGDFRLVLDGVVADLYAERDAYPGVKRALMDLRDDIHGDRSCPSKQMGPSLSTRL